MIPHFDVHGYLPPGLHPANLDEIESRFGKQTALRRDQMENFFATDRHSIPKGMIEVLLCA